MFYHSPIQIGIPSVTFQMFIPCCRNATGDHGAYGHKLLYKLKEGPGGRVPRLRGLVGLMVVCIPINFTQGWDGCPQTFPKVATSGRRLLMHYWQACL